MVGTKGYRAMKNYTSTALQGDDRKTWTAGRKALEDMKVQDLKNIMCEYTGKCQPGYGASKYKKDQMIECILGNCTIKPTSFIPKTAQQVDNILGTHVLAVAKMLKIDGRTKMNTDELRDAIKKAIRKEQQRR